MSLQAKIKKAKTPEARSKNRRNRRFKYQEAKRGLLAGLTVIFPGEVPKKKT